METNVKLTFSSRYNPDDYYHLSSEQSVTITECNNIVEKYFKDRLIPLLSTFSDLEELDISAIQSSDPNKHYMGYIPDEVFEIVSLKKLNISLLDLTNIPTSINQLINLEELYIRHNHDLITLPDELLSLPKLKYIHCCSCGKLDLINAKFTMSPIYGPSIIDLTQSILL